MSTSIVKKANLLKSNGGCSSAPFMLNAQKYLKVQFLVLFYMLLQYKNNALVFWLYKLVLDTLIVLNTTITSNFFFLLVVHAN